MNRSRRTETIAERRFRRNRIDAAMTLATSEMVRLGWRMRSLGDLCADLSEKVRAAQAAIERVGIADDDMGGDPS